MTAKKRHFQKDFNQFLDQAKTMFTQFGKELNILAKRGEKEIVKASKAGKIQLDIVSLNMQKEKLYYDAGKKIFSVNTKKKLDIPEFETYFKKMRKLETDTRKKKREISRVKKNRK